MSQPVQRSMPWGKEKRPDVDHPIFKWAKENGIHIQHFTPYQTRLKIANKVTCDVYLTNMRYHIIRHPNMEMVQQRGDIPKEFVLLLESLFLNV